MLHSRLSLQKIEQKDEEYDSDEDLKKFGRWLDNILPNTQGTSELQELKLQDEEFNPERDLEKLERLLAEGSDKEQEQPELQEPTYGLTITTTCPSVFLVCVSKHGVTILTLEKVLKHDPFMSSTQPVRTLAIFLGFMNSSTFSQLLKQRAKFYKLVQRKYLMQ